MKVVINEEVSLEDFLDKKRDYSPYLVHLTKDSCVDVDDGGEFEVSAKEWLDQILDEKILRTFNHFCFFSPTLKESQIASLQDKFKVVCFTETPITQINVILNKVKGRRFEPAQYGLVFTKQYIRRKGGNPVFYATTGIARMLWPLYR